MPRFPEIVQFRAPAGAKDALNALARAEGRPPYDILRDLLAERLQATAARTDPAQRAA